MHNAAAAIGHNSAPEIDVMDIFRDQLKEKAAPLSQRLSELEVGLAKVPETVTAESESQVVDFIKQCKATVKDVEAWHKETKQPHWDRGKAVDVMKTELLASVSPTIKTVESRLTAYHNKKAEEERKAREAEEKRLAEKRAEAERKAEAARQKAEEEARAAKTTEEREQAAAAMQNASEAEAKTRLLEEEQAAQQKAANQSNALRGDYGGTGVRQKVTTIEVDNYADVDMVLLWKYLPTPAIDQAIRAAMADGVEQIRGVKITHSHKTVVR